MARTRVTGGALRRARARTASSVVLPSPLETLERRALLAAFVVTDPADAGPGTLRQAILDANITTGADTITFNLPGTSAVRTVRPLSALPEVTGQTTIDGSTRPGVIVELDGSLAGAGANGLTVSASQSAVRGLVVNRFSAHGVAVVPATVNGRPGPAPTAVRIEGNLIGTDWTGTLPLGNRGAGIFHNASASFIGSATPTATETSARNVISGNGGPGVWVVGTSPAQGPSLFGNYIGTSASGSRAVPNGREGVLVEGVARLIIGGNTPATRNVISGNASSGVRVATTSGQVEVRNNYIGTNAAGTGAIPNGWSAALPYHDGITVQSGFAFIVGGPSPGTPQAAMRNVISGNVGAGIRVETSQDTQIVGNYIGTDATGFTDVGNGGGGVVVAPLDPTATNAANVARLTGNLISGNDGDGVFFGTGSSVALAFGGNYIGTNAAGTAALGNSGNGVSVAFGVTIPSIGAQGPVPTPTPPGNSVINPAGATRNVISANGGHGIQVLGGGIRSVTTVRAIVNNYIGTDSTGTLPLGNGGSGIYATAVRMNIGGAGPSIANLGNVISANGGNGITLVAPAGAQAGAPVNNNILGNRIGAAAVAPNTPPQPPGPGTDTGLGNRGHGIAVFNSGGNRIGDGNATGANVIAYNGGSGVLVEGGTAAPSPIAVATAPTLITANSIYGNGGLGIDLSPSGAGEGVTPNDARDADAGPNGLQNFPTITEAVVNPAGTSVQIRFVLMSEPSRSYRVEFFSSPLPDPSGYGEGRTYLGFATASGDASGTASGTFTAPVTAGTNLYFTATATQTPVNITSEFSPAVRGTPQPPGPPIGPADVEVTQRRVFYDGSAFDGQLAEDKVALLPGQIPSPANITDYTRGINGIELMFFSPQITVRPAVTADDFEFRTGTAGPSSLWAAAPTPVVTLIPVPGPNRVYELTWPEGAVRNAWLEVTIKANERTGLAAPDVFYFGNLVGETGDSVSQLRVSALDLAGTRTHGGEQAGIDSHYDHNRDGVVNALDVAAVRANLGRSLSTPTAIPVVLPPPDEPTDQAADSVTAAVLG